MGIVSKIIRAWKSLRIKKNLVVVLVLCAVIFFDWGLLFLLEKEGFSSKELQSASGFEAELCYFPIPKAGKETDLSVSFADSWKGERTYGGNRVHEGCDIITSKDQPGVYPVISISDGVVEKLGWLELGGYRIGIRTESGLYLYYAHLESYAPEIQIGSNILAGECLGFVGDSGYGTEGTTGQFVTHLHLGFYIPDGESDVAINPYPYLKQLQSNQLTYHYQEP